ncbi:MAG: transposase [Bryobacterales bacterium]|nr:transposase [Bryobacterales bacterium]
MEDFARHYGTAILPTKPVAPRHKGKVEAGVKYAQNNAVKGRRFESLAAQNLFLAEWERTVADTRLHGTTCQQAGKLFAEVEQPLLRPLPAMVFPAFTEARRTVHRDGYVEWQRGLLLGAARIRGPPGLGASKPGWSASTIPGANRSPCTPAPNRGSSPPIRLTFIAANAI